MHLQATVRDPACAEQMRDLSLDIKRLQALTSTLQKGQTIWLDLYQQAFQKVCCLCAKGLYCCNSCSFWHEFASFLWWSLRSTTAVQQVRGSYMAVWWGRSAAQCHHWAFAADTCTGLQVWTPVQYARAVVQSGPHHIDVMAIATCIAHSSNAA